MGLRLWSGLTAVASHYARQWIVVRGVRNVQRLLADATRCASSQVRRIVSLRCAAGTATVAFQREARMMLGRFRTLIGSCTTATAAAGCNRGPLPQSVAAGAAARVPFGADICRTVPTRASGTRAAGNAAFI